ncbi:MAG TPA: hypothetical protein ENK27_05260 [Desulfobulbus sp.]|nr:hypothetical protein [Desulfobulbus sp.]
MATARKKKTRPKKKKGPKRFRFQLGLAGVAGIGVVLFCLFLWMFLLGIWAGQTILLPTATPPRPGTLSGGNSHAAKPPARAAVIRPEGKKKAVARGSDH